MFYSPPEKTLIHCMEYEFYLSILYVPVKSFLILYILYVEKSSVCQNVRIHVHLLWMAMQSCDLMYLIM